LKNYIDFWICHRNVLTDGDIEVYGVESGYTMASSTLNNENVTVIYNNQIMQSDSNVNYSVFNASGDNYLYFELNNTAKYTVNDYFGNVYLSGTINNGINKINVKNGYMIKIN
jgi:hypothetical protein